MKRDLTTALLIFLLMTVITGLVYPGVVTAIAQVVMNDKANGSLIVADGKTVGSSLIGQPFSDPRYFWSRPSATSPQPYNALAIERIESRSDQSGVDRSGAAADRCAAQGRSEQQGTGTARPRDCVRQRARPAHQPRRGRVSSGPRRARSQHRCRPSANAGGAPHRRPAARCAGRAESQRAAAEPRVGRVAVDTWIGGWAT